MKGPLDPTERDGISEIPMSLHGRSHSDSASCQPLKLGAGFHIYENRKVIYILISLVDTVRQTNQPFVGEDGHVDSVLEDHDENDKC